MSEKKVSKDFEHVPISPIIVKRKKQLLKIKKFDVAELFSGSAPVAEEGDDKVVKEQKWAPDEKARRAYYWIVNNALISPYYDLEFNKGPRCYKVHWGWYRCDFTY